MAERGQPGLGTGWKDRRRQAIIVLAVGAALALGGLIELGVPVPQTNPARFEGTFATADGERMYLVGMAQPQESGSVLKFLTVETSDGMTWSKAVERSGALLGATACNGWLYCLVHDGKKAPQVSGYQGDRWRVLESPFGWWMTGLGEREGELWAFGTRIPRTPGGAVGTETGTVTGTQTETGKGREKPGSEGGTETRVSGAAGSEAGREAGPAGTGSERAIHTAVFRTDRWEEGPKLESAEGMPGNFYLAEGYLYWQEAGLAGAGKFGAKIYRASFDGTKFGEVESFDLGEEEVCVVVGEPGRTLVLGQKVETLLIAGAAREGIHRQVIEGGKLKDEGDLEIEEFRKRSQVVDEFTATRFKEKTWLMASGRYYGIYMAGMECFELGGGRAVNGHMAMKATGQQVLSMAFFTVMSWVGIALAASGVVGVGASLLKREGEEAAGKAYATLLVRGMASAIDFFLVMFIPWMWLAGTQAEAVQAVLVGAAGVVAYGTIMEMNTGQTVGKRIAGVKVMRTNGSGPRFVEALVRNLLKPLELFTFGGAVILGTRRFQRVGDLLAKTVVVTWTGSQPGKTDTKEPRSSGEE